MTPEEASDKLEVKHTSYTCKVRKPRGKKLYEVQKPYEATSPIAGGHYPFKTPISEADYFLKIFFYVLLGVGVILLHVWSNDRVMRVQHNKDLQEFTQAKGIN